MNPKRKNWLYILLASLGITGGTYVAVNNAAPQQQASTSSPSISVTTTNAKSINFVMGNNAVDIFFLKQPAQGVQRNLLDPTYSNLVKASGFTDLVYPAAASISRYAHQKNGVGYVGQQSDFPSYAEFAAYGNGELVAPFTQNFATNEVNFTKAIGFSNSISLNIKNGNFNEHKAMLSAFQPKYIFLGNELQTSGMTVSAYNDSCNKIIPYIRTNYPNAIIIGNTTVWYRGNKASINWNDSASQLPVDAFVNYQQPDDNVTFTTNQDSNIIRLQYYFYTEVVTQDSTFNAVVNKDTVTKKKRYESIGEWFLEGNRGSVQYVNRTLTGMYGLGMFYQSYLSRNSLINYTAWMSLNNLISGNNTPDQNYKALKVLNQLIGSTKKVTSITFTNMDGVSGASVIDGTNNIIVINNASKNAYTPTVKVDNKSVKSSFIMQRFYGKDWYSAITQDSISSVTLSIPACSMSVVSFQSGK